MKTVGAAASVVLVAAFVQAAIPPSVRSVSPADAAKGVSLDTEIRLELETAQDDPGLQLFDATTGVEVPVRLESLEKWSSSAGCPPNMPGCARMGAHCVYRLTRPLRPNTRYRIGCRSGISGCTGTFTTGRPQPSKRPSARPTQR